MDSTGHEPHAAQRTRPRAGRPAAIGLGLVAALALTACGAGDPEVPAAPEPTADGPVLVGAGPTEQTRTIANIWILQLQDAGLDAEIREVDGGREGYVRAVDEDLIDVYPDYTGDLYLELRGNPAEGPGTALDETGGESPSASAPPRDDGVDGGDDGLVDSLSAMLGQGSEQDGVTDEDVEDALRAELPEGVGILGAAPAENTRALAVTAATAARLPGSSIEDLAEVCPELSFGAVDGADQAPVTAAAIEDVYGCEPGEIIQYPTQQEVFQALLRDDVQVASILSADPAVQDNALSLLEDSRDALVPERVVPVADEELPAEARDAVNEVTGRIDTEALVLMTRMTDSETPYSPEEAARYWWDGASG